MLVRSRVKPFQPTILLDGLIVSLAAGALTAVVMYAVVLRGAEASTAVLALKLAFPLCAAMLLAFSIWVIALIGWKPNRMWLTAAIGLALATVASASFVVQIVHGNYAAGSVLDSLWLGAGLLLVYAAWQPHDDALPVKLEGSRRLSATSAAATAALAVLVVGQFLSVGFAAVTLAAATLVALIARAAVSFKESLQMFADARIEAQTDSLTGARQPPQADDGPAARAPARERGLPARAGAVRPRRLQALQRHLRPPGGRRPARTARRRISAAR